MATPQFTAVGSTAGLGLQTLTAVGEGTSDTVMIQTLDAYGNAVDSYIWCDWAGESGDQKAWSDGSGEILEGVTFAPGQGLWIQGSSVSQSVLTAGEVGTFDIVVNLTEGFTAAGNPFPVAVNLQDIVVSGEGTSDTVMIQTLDAYGNAVDSYIWCDWAGESGDQKAWSDGSGEILEGVTFAPGQGLWIQGSSSSQAVRFPAPEL